MFVSHVHRGAGARARAHSRRSQLAWDLSAKCILNGLSFFTLWCLMLWTRLWGNICIPHERTATSLVNENIIWRWAEGSGGMDEKKRTAIVFNLVSSSWLSFFYRARWRSFRNSSFSFIILVAGFRALFLHAFFASFSYFLSKFYLYSPKIPFRIKHSLYFPQKADDNLQLSWLVYFPWHFVSFSLLKTEYAYRQQDYGAFEQF